MYKLRNLKYRHKIAAIIFIFTLFPTVILGMFLGKRIWDSRVKDVLAENQAQLTSSINGINGLISSYEDKISFINNNYSVNTFFQTNMDLELVEIMSFNDYLQGIMEAVIADHSSINIAIYSLNVLSFSNDYLKNIEILESIETGNGRNIKDEILKFENGKTLWRLLTLKSGSAGSRQMDYLCAYRKIVLLNRPLAIAEVRIPFNKIMEYFQYDIPKGSFIVFEEANSLTRKMVKSNESDMQSETVLQEPDFYEKMNRTYYILDMDLKSGIGEIAMLIPKNLIFKELRVYLFTVIAIFLLFSVILFLAVEVISHVLTKKLENLFQTMNTNAKQLISNENINIHASDDEFGTIYKMLNELILKIKEYYQKIADYELEKKVLETQLLQERINPHFLYNTLSTMKWICSDQRIQQVIESMVKYYRIALNKGSSIITITQEMEMLAEYMRLQKFAYGKEFEFQIEIEEGTGDCLVLKNLLQPIVENAILHGLNNRETGGIIRIASRKHGDAIFITISDNGSGIDPVKLGKILKETNNKSFGGYGIRNIQKRIEAFYGKEYGMEIESKLNEGTTVTIKTPAVLNTDSIHPVR